MRKLLIIISIIFLYGCQNGCLSAPELKAEGEVDSVEYVGSGGLIGSTKTIINKSKYG